MSTDASAGRLLRQGLDLVMDWADGVSCRLEAWRDGREGVRGELTVRLAGARLLWGNWALGSPTTREAFAKRLAADAPEVPWRTHLEESAVRFTQAVRVGESMRALPDVPADAAALLLPGWLYAGEPTLLYADGDSGKSLTAMTLAVALQSGCALPSGLLPVRPVPTLYLDWEATPQTAHARLAAIAGGLGIVPPPVLYKRMTRPLVDEIGRLSADVAARHIGFVIVDSKMFAVAGGEGAAFHEPITAFYEALRLLAPAAVLVLNHVTNADARTGIPARPFGGAFAWNSPRLIWEAKRDPEIEDSLAVVYTCRKANNQLTKPPAFGLRFAPDTGSIRVSALNLAEVTPSTLAGASLTTRIQAMLSEPLSVDALVEALHAKAPSVSRILRRLRTNGVVTSLDDGRWVAQRGQLSASRAGQSASPSSAPREEGTSQPLPRADGHSSYIGGVRLSANDDVPDRTEPAWITDPD